MTKNNNLDIKPNSGQRELQNSSPDQLYSWLLEQLQTTGPQKPFPLPLVQFAEGVLESCGCGGLGYPPVDDRNRVSCLREALTKLGDPTERQNYSAAAVSFAALAWESSLLSEASLVETCAELIRFLELDPKYFRVRDMDQGWGVRIKGTRALQQEFGLLVELTTR